MMKYWLTIIFLLFSLSSTNVLATVTASIDRQDIAEGETFTLTIQIDKDADVQPDLSMIPKEFTIISSSQYKNTQIYNGKQTLTKGWHIQLKTLETGHMIIPAIEVGNEFTQPIQLRIKDTSNTLKNHKNLTSIFIESDSDLKSVYVQQQVIYTVSIYIAIKTHYAAISEPTASNSIVEKLGDDEQFERVLNGQRYLVTRRKYAIFPQQSGEIEISSVNFTAEVTDQRRRQSFGSFLTPKRSVSLKTPTIKLEVKPKPAGINYSWLPASSVTLTDKWSTDTQSLNVGEPVTWTILLSAQGLSESQLPEIEIPSIDGLQWYYDAPKKEQKLNSTGILGSRTEKLAVIPSKAGKITLPAIKIEWWDIASNTTKEAVLPERILNVLPAAKKAQTSGINLPQTIPAAMTGNAAPTIINNEALKQWQLIAGVLFIMWVITLLAYFRKKPQNAPLALEASPHQPHDGNANKIFADLKLSIQSDNTRKTESLLLQWIKLSGFKKINSLGKLANKLSDSKLKNKVTRFESDRYCATHPDQPVVFSQSELKQILSDLNQQQKSATKKPAIPPLYPGGLH